MSGCLEWRLEAEKAYNFDMQLVWQMIRLRQINDENADR